MKDEGAEAEAEAPPQRMQGVPRMHGGSGAEQQQPHDVQQRDSEEERMWSLLWEEQQEQEQEQVMAAAPGGVGVGGWYDVRRRLEAGGFSTVASLASLDEAQLDQLGVAHGPPRQRLLTHVLLLRRLAASLLSSLLPLSSPAVLSPPLPSSSSSSGTNPGTMASSSFFSPLPPRRTHRGRGHQHHGHHHHHHHHHQQQHEDDEPSDDDDDEEEKDAGHPSSGSLALFGLMSYGARRMLAGLERSGELPARTTTPRTSGHPAAERTHDVAAAAEEEEEEEGAPGHDAQQQQQQRAAAMEELRARRMILQREFSFRAIKSLWLDAEACAARHRQQQQHVQEQEQQQELLEAISAALGPGRGSSSPRPTPTAGAPSDGEAGAHGRTDGQQPLPRFNTNIAAAAAAVGGGGGGGDKEEGTRAAATGAHRQKKKKLKQTQMQTHKEPTTTKTTTAGESAESTDPDSQTTTTTTPTTPTKTKVVPKPVKTKLHKAPKKSRAGSAPCGGGAPNASETREPRRRGRGQGGDAKEENGDDDDDDDEGEEEEDGEEAGEGAAASVMMASFLVLIDEVLALCQLVRNRAPVEVLADKAAFVEFMALKKRHFYFHPPPPPPPPPGHHHHHHDSGGGGGGVGMVHEDEDKDEDDDEENENGTTTGQEGGGQVPADQRQARCWQSGGVHLRGRGVRDDGELAHSGTQQQQQPRQHRPSSATTDAVGTAEEEEEEDVGDAKFPYRKLVQRKDSMRGRGRLHDKRSRSLVTLGSAIHRRHHHQQQHQQHQQHGRAGSSHSQDEDAMKSLSVEYNIRKTLTSSESWMLFFQAAQRRHSERASTEEGDDAAAAAAPAEVGSCGSSPEGGKGKLAKTKGAYLFISSSEVKKKRKSLDGLRRDHHLVTKPAATAPTPARGHLAAPDHHHHQQHGARGEHQMALESGEVSASLALDDMDWATHTEEGRVARELVYTEWTYERDLRLLYEEPLLRHSKEGEGEAAAAGGARLTQDEVEHIFCHTRPLQGCSAALLQGLIAACRLPSPARNDAIGRCFLAHMATLEAVYRNHCSHYPLVVQTLKQLTTVRPGFAAFLEEVQMQPSSRRLRLLDFLIKPMQRLCKYPLLLAQLVEAAGAPEESLLRRAHSKIAEAVSSIDQAHQLMGLHALTDLYNRFVGGPPPELVAAGRRLVREGVVRVRKRDSKSIKRSDRVLLLFNDALVIAKEKKRDSREDETRKDNGDGDARRRMLRLKILLPLRLCVVANDYHKRGFTIHQSRDSSGESTTSHHHHHRPHSLLVVPSTDRLVFLVKETEERDQWVEDIRACAQACHHQS